MKIAVYPYASTFPNKYIERMVEAFRNAYPDIDIIAFPPTKKLMKLISCDYVWLNWFENLPHKNKFRKFVVRVFILLFLSIVNIKIISTFHNQEPHESSNSLLDRILFYLVFRLSYKIIILSSDSLPIIDHKFGEKALKKAVLIMHPTYDCIPKEIKKDNKQFNVLFFGHLRPYKNIELIFELARDYKDLTFTIAGSAIDKEYEDELKSQAEQISNINLISHFLSSSEIDHLIDTHSILILPYNLKSSLNSGVVIHAICKRINIIVPEIGTVNQLKNRNQLFSYTYTSEEEHLIKLKTIISQAKNEFYDNSDKFNQRTTILYNEVVANQSPKALSEKIKQLFK